MQVHVENRKSIRVVCLRHLGPYGEVHLTWAKLRAWANLRGLLGPMAQFIGVSHDDPETTAPEQIRYATRGWLSMPIAFFRVISGTPARRRRHDPPAHAPVCANVACALTRLHSLA